MKTVSYILSIVLTTALVGVALVSLGLLVINIVYAHNLDPDILQENFQFYNDDGTTVNDATAYGGAAEDANITGVPLGEKFHLRIQGVQSANKPDQNLTSYTKLQYGTGVTGGDCSTGSSWFDVPIETAWGSEPFMIASTTNFTDGDTTTKRLSGTSAHMDGDGIEYQGSANPVVWSLSLGAGLESTEWEWSLKEMAGTEGVQYWFRLVLAAPDVTTDFIVDSASGAVCPSLTTVSGNDPPEVSSVVLDGGTAITLTENTTTAVSATANVSDPNGADDIVSATSTIYRSVVGAGCTANDNNCYKISSCTFSGATSTVTCTANIQFFADPTDASSTDYSAEDWQAEITITDSAGATGASNTLSGVELNTLWAINVTAPISYGGVNPTADTGSTNQTVTVTNTGNAAIDVEVSGTDMTLSGSTIGVANQKYATSTFTYSSCTVCTALSSTPTAYKVDLLKPTSATPVTDDVFWGLAVPDGTAQGAHSGTNTFAAIGEL